MLPAALRLGSSAQITATLKSGRRYSSDYLVLHIASSPGPTQCAFAVSKKVGNSVIRHRITRQLRHIVQENQDTIPENCLIVIRALPQAKDASFQELFASMRQALAKVRT